MLPVWLPSWLGVNVRICGRSACLGFDSYYWLNALDYPVLVVVDVVSTLKFDSPWRVHRAWPWKVPWLSEKKKKKSPIF